MLILSPFQKRLLNEGGWSTFGKVFAALGTLVGIRLITECVSKDIYGKVILLIGIITLGGNLFASPLISAAQRFHPEAVLSQRLPQLRCTVSRMLKRNTGTLACLFLIGGAIYARLNGISFLVFLAMTAFLLVQITQSFEISLLTAARRQREIAIWLSLEAWLKPILAIALVFLFGDATQHVLWGYFIAVAVILLRFYLSPAKPEGTNGSSKTFITDRKLISDIRRYAMPLVPLALVAWISTLSDRYIIAGMLGSASVGIYAACYGLLGMPFLMAGGIIGQTLRPPYYQAVSAGNINLAKKLLKTQLTITALVCGVGVVAVFFLRNIIAALLLAKEYRSAVSLMTLIAAGITFQVITQIFESILIAYKRTGFLLIIHSFGAVVCVLSVYFLIRRFNLIGAAMACPVYYLSMLILSMIMAAITLKKPKTVTK
ncbi:MAG: oligosaccharide flippase family protein [Planctomycetes bacterium]|nr:oligosaccharide flippase family protein [Planctomycetota bacterium]